MFYKIYNTFGSMGIRNYCASDHSYVSSLRMPTIEVTGSLEVAATPPEDDAAGTEPRSVDVPVLYEIALILCMLCVVYLIGRFR